MELNTSIGVDAVKAIVVETLHLEDRADALEPTTPLLGAVPELDSMGVLELLLELEQRFGITIDGEDVTAEVFETLESLTAFIDAQLR